MDRGPRAAVPRLRHEGLVNIGVAIAGAAVTYLAFGEWFYGWMAGLLIGLFGGRVLARRRPDLADHDPAQPSELWQRVLVGVLLVAVAVAVAITLSN